MTPESRAPRVVVVDDDRDARAVLAAGLERDGFRVLSFGDAEGALAQALSEPPDIVVSDVVLPGMDGVRLCARLKADHRTAVVPVILLSGLQKGERQLVEGIEKGADDYLPKPYSYPLLLAKVRALLRRRPADGPVEEVLRVGGLALDLSSRTAKVRGRPVHLTRKEFDLLAAFLRSRGRVLGANGLLESVWGYDPADYNDPHTLQSHLSSLRRKLGPTLAKRIVSVPGIGYRFEI